MPVKTSIAFIVRAKQHDQGWHLVLHNLITAEQQVFNSFEACSQAMLQQAQVKSQKPQLRKENT